MAQRRMFSLDVVDTDVFLDLPASSQNLYFHMGMRADDDGFVSSPKKITTMVNCSGDDLRLLVSKGLVIPFETGVCVIRDWKINNYIQKDRYRESRYIEEKSLLGLTGSGAYLRLDTSCIQNVSRLDTQVRLGKDRKGESETGGIGEVPPTPSPTHPPKQTRKKFGQYSWVQLTDGEHSRLLNDLGESEFKRCVAYIDESAQATWNKNKWRDWNLVLRRCSREGWGKQGEPLLDPPKKLDGYVEVINGEEVFVVGSN